VEVIKNKREKIKMYKISINQDTFELTKEDITAPKRTGAQMAEYLRKNTKTYLVNSLTEHFYAMETAGSSNDLCHIHVTSPENSFEDTLLGFTENNNMRSIFNTISLLGFAQIPTLSLGIPFQFFKDKKTEEKIDEFIHNTFTQAIEKGDRSNPDYIKIKYEGWLPEENMRRDDFINHEQAVIVPSAIHKIEDKGAYRKIFFKNALDKKYPVSLTTELSVKDLEKKLGPQKIDGPKF
jgi:hypothetical protein